MTKEPGIVKRVLICGGRDFNDWETFRNELEKIAQFRFARHPPDKDDNWLYDVTVIEGGARGADNLAEQWAMINWCPLKEYKADWKKHKLAAGPLRNMQMLTEGRPELVVAFPGGRGTADMVAKARAYGVEVIEVKLDRCTCQNQHRRGYCTESTCPYKLQVLP